MFWHPWLRIAFLVLVSVSLAGLAFPSQAAARNVSTAELTATLDGRPLALKQVADYYCDDFSYPEIHCFSNPTMLESRVSPLLATTSIDYVTIYDFALFAGSYMYMSQDYTVLATIGWNDRIGSFIARNGETGHFYTDWFYGGTSYVFCCNQQQGNLGSFNNTFSSVHRQ